MFDVLLKINGIVGEGTGGAHKDWIDILGLKQGGEPTDGGVRAVTGTVAAPTESAFAGAEHCNTRREPLFRAGM